MSIETVNIVLRLVNARVSGIQRDGVVVVALIVAEIRQERQVPSAILLLVETIVPGVILRLRFLKLKLSGTSALLLNAVDRNGNRVSGVHFSGLEAPRLIHIDPDTIISELIVEVLETTEPHLGRLLVEPVNKDGDLGPHLIDQVVVVLLALV